MANSRTFAASADYSDPSVLARRLADYVVLAVAPEVPLSAPDYFQASEASYRDVRDLVAAQVAGDAAASGPYRHVLRDPAHAAAIRALRAELARLIAHDPDWGLVAARRAAAADERIWIDHWLGDAFADDDAPDVDLGALPVPARDVGREGSTTRIDVIIPFRDPTGGQRLRNTIACLRALADQDPVDASVRVTLVEADTTDRSRASLAPLADRYLHVRKDGPFNKSWTVNVGLREARRSAPAASRHVVCVLDADILVDRVFLTANLARFDTGEHRAHLPFRRVLAMDDAASSYAIRRRLVAQAAAVELESLRGLLWRDSPGGCLWAEGGLMHEIGGFDERFEGWGGEDDDVTQRIAGHAPFERYDDLLLHLAHPRPQMTMADGTPNNGHLLDSHLGQDGWTGKYGYGDPGRFRAVTPGEER